jgi:hypothetical protein
MKLNLIHNFSAYSPQQSSMNHMFSEDYIEGFREDGRMSVIRRFFCLFVTFDLIFITLLWIISVVVIIWNNPLLCFFFNLYNSQITGENIYHAFDVQVKNYSIYTSLFDIVINALVRFIFLILFYGIIYINHWIIVAVRKRKWKKLKSCCFVLRFRLFFSAYHDWFMWIFDFQSICLWCELENVNYWIKLSEFQLFIFSFWCQHNPFSKYC